MWAPSVLAAGRQAPGVEVVVAAVRVWNLPTGYVHGHSTVQQPVQEQALIATLPVEAERGAEEQISVAQRQVLVRVSVALDQRRA
jgi:hypothetical protein